MNSPLHRQNPTQRFSDRATDYASFRPTYPPESIAALLQNLTVNTIADVGAGTGIAAGLLANFSNATVIAIEPNAAMRTAASPHLQIQWQGSTAEQTGLADQSVDLVTCFQSFHWFDQPVALAEFHRILKPQGRVALIWNDRNLEDEFTAEHHQIIDKAADPNVFRNQERKSDRSLAESPLFKNHRALTFYHHHRLNIDGFIGLAASSSYIAKSGEAYETMVAELRALCDRWQTRLPLEAIGLAYKTEVYLAEPVSESLESQVSI
jgi:ubiquinone/menaquinone biosynthesis C-methylase UbiE